MTVNAKYAYAAGKANTAITEWGEPVTLIQPGESTFDPATGMTSSGEDVETSCRAVFMPMNQMRVDNTNILASDMTCKIAAAGISVIPEVGEKIERGSREYAILAVRTIGPDGTPIIYDLDLRVS
jgi:hypothetical protein